MGNFVLFYCNMRLNELRISEIYIMILRYCNIAILWYHSHIIELLHPIVSAGPPGRPPNLPWQNTVYISPHSHNWLELIKVNAALIMTILLPPSLISLCLLVRRGVNPISLGKAEPLHVISQYLPPENLQKFYKSKCLTRFEMQQWNLTISPAIEPLEKNVV